MKILLLLLTVSLVACQRNTDPLGVYNHQFSDDISKDERIDISKTSLSLGYTKQLGNFYLNEKDSQEIDVNMDIDGISYNVELLEAPKGMTLTKKEQIFKLNWNPTLDNLEVSNQNELERETHFTAYIKLIATEDESKENKFLLKKIDKLPIEIVVIDTSKGSK